MRYNDELLTKCQDELIKTALDAVHHAYAPYSHFAVGAAVLCDNGDIVAGCNVENASYGATLCAERNAISAAVAKANHNFIAIAIAAKDDSFAFPCGICRQVMSEFNKELKVILCNSKGEQQSYKLTELIPHAFALEK